jgi:uncharacterized membrane-anchored protein
MAGIAVIVVGVIVAVLGIINMTGNISSLHWYHRKNVTEENVKPFGRMVGLGTLIIGVAVALYGGVLALFAENEPVVLISTALMFVGMIAGIVITFRAMFKYNGGIF